MIKGDKALTPQIAFTGTKATIEAWTGAVVGMEAYATDNPSAPFGVYNGVTWDWIGAGGGGSSDHATLTNLSYATAGHTGFEPAKGADDNYVTDAEKIVVGNTSGANTGDITLAGTPNYLTLVGQVITRLLISLAHMADVATGTIFYRKTAGTGSPEVQTLVTLKTDLGLSGTNTGDQSLAGLQPLDADLTAIASLSPANDDIIQRKAGVWTSRTVAQYLADIKLSNGIATNYKIVPSVASNNLTVALKGLDGNDPSPTNPIVVQIGGAMRTITAALLVTKNAGTNWCNAGGAELATFETDYFVYLGYNATDGVTIGWSRINHATRYDDFSATSTNDLYCAISTITNAAASDNYVVIGRFAATLSAGAGYIWTVPTYTTTNLIQRPIYEIRLLNLTSTRTGFNATLPTMTISYKLVGRSITYGAQTTASGTSNATTFTMSLPFTSNSKNYAILPIGGVDNGLALDRPSAVYIGTSTRVATMFKYFDLGGTLWTASGNKNVNGTFYYEI